MAEAGKSSKSGRSGRTGRSGRFVLWTFAVFAVVLFYKAFRFRYPNFLFNYPFVSYDGFQWVTDSLHYLDRSVDAIHRNPALPLTFAVLKVFGAVDFFPVLLSVLTLAFYAAGYWMMRPLVDRKSAWLVTVWFFFVFRIHGFFDYVLSDPWCLVTITMGLGCLLRLRRAPKYLVGAAAAFGLALNYQFAPAFMAPALIWFVWRETGSEWFRLHFKMAAIAVGVFLALALPQFVYKWIAFGSPLYSHVIHFPLLRIHFFGVPYYAVNFMAFLGWPLALLVSYGLFSAFRRKDARWELIHLGALLMAAFWVLAYLWLDVRFLLYLVPFWMVYAGYGAELLNLSRVLSWKGKTWFQRVAAVFVIYVCLSLSAHKTNPFESTLLPVAPQVAIRFNSEPISEWGVGALRLAKLDFEYADNSSNLNMPFNYIKYYRGIARGVRDVSGVFILDAIKISELIAAADAQGGSKQPIALCGDLGTVHETSHRLKFALARNVSACDSLRPEQRKWTVHRAPKFKADGDGEIVYRGEELILVREKAGAS
jgi:hypothetical protein